MNAQKRRRVIAGNWKMYKTQADTRAFFAAFNPLVAGIVDCDIVIAPPFTNIPAAVEATKATKIGISAQNVYWEKEGAFTGEVSAAMLVEGGCRYTIIGHSERRQFFGETNETVLKKTKAALAAGLTPIACIGEMLADREAGKDTMPNFVMLRFGNDHTAGTTPGGPTPKSSVADNDLAIGRAVEAVSHSPYWDDTAFFILEDDAQN